MLTIHHANVLDWARDYTGPKFHALLCDPPYELGFMGKAWDKSGVPFRADTWAALAAHLHPGAFLMAFASSRGWHRQAVAMEDAGLVIHPTLFGWAFGSGFPKATRIDTQVDKAAGAEQQVIGVKRASIQRNGDGENWKAGAFGSHPEETKRVPITAPATPTARAWVGHRYGLQALKPALEPVIVAQVPYQGRPVDCITRTGAGALWVDGGRIEGGERQLIEKECDLPSNGIYGAGLNGSRCAGVTQAGRWPANFYLANDAAAARLDEMSGTCRSSGAYNRGDSVPQGGAANFGISGGVVQYTDTGGASRFFFRVAEQLDDADLVYYCAKASRRERDAGLDGMAERVISVWGGDEDDLSEGKKSTVPRRNPHPTLKPLSLTRYLATLLLPPAEYGPRRLLVPFAGVGSECVGAMMAGWDEIEGVELMNDEQHPYIDIARKRFDYWQAKHQPALMEVTA
jgi:site-specific DNA-methyltransferase (adenine-specific)